MEERIGFDRWSPWLAEHRARYAFARSSLGGRRIVLDVACGTGIGADLIATPGRVVLGTDLSQEAVHQARRRRIAGYHVFRSDGTQLPLKDDSVDAILSFETVEHICDDVAFVQELRRVLRNDGILVLSTPNAVVTQPVNGVPGNPFHIREYRPDELQRLLQPCFGQVSLFGQRTSDEYGACPYWEGRQRRAGRARVDALLWRFIVRLPQATAARVSRGILRRELYPTADDFVFVAGNHAQAQAHVLVAVCQP